MSRRWSACLTAAAGTGTVFTDGIPDTGRVQFMVKMLAIPLKFGVSSAK